MDGDLSIRFLFLILEKYSYNPFLITVSYGEFGFKLLCLGIVLISIVSREAKWHEVGRFGFALLHVLLAFQRTVSFPET